MSIEGGDRPLDAAAVPIRRRRGEGDASFLQGGSDTGGQCLVLRVWHDAVGVRTVERRHDHFGVLQVLPQRNVGRCVAQPRDLYWSEGTAKRKLR